MLIISVTLALMAHLYWHKIHAIYTQLLATASQSKYIYLPGKYTNRAEHLLLNWTMCNHMFQCTPVTYSYTHLQTGMRNSPDHTRLKAIMSICIMWAVNGCSKWPPPCTPLANGCVDDLIKCSAGTAAKHRDHVIMTSSAARIMESTGYSALPSPPTLMQRAYSRGSANTHTARQRDGRRAKQYLLRSLKPWLQLRFDYDTTTIRLRRISTYSLYHNCDWTTIRRYHEAFDYDGSDRNYSLRSIRLRYDYDTTRLRRKLTCSFFVRIEWKQARAIRRSQIVVVS